MLERNSCLGSLGDTTTYSINLNLLLHRPGTVFTTLHFLRILNISSVSWSVTSHLTEIPAITNTLAYWAIRKLRRKLSVVNTAPGMVFCKKSRGGLNYRKVAIS